MPFEARDDEVALGLDAARLSRCQDGEHAATGHAVGHCKAGRIEERGRKVGEAHEVCHGAPFRYPGRPHHHERHMAPKVVGRGLAARLLAAVTDRSAVVGGHHHERVLQEAAFLEAREHPRQVAVSHTHLVHKIRPCLTLPRRVLHERRQRHLIERHAKLLLEQEVVVRAGGLVGLHDARPEEERLVRIPRLEEPRKVARVVVGMHALGRVGDHLPIALSPQRFARDPERGVRTGPPAFARARHLVTMVGEDLRHGRILLGDEGLDEASLLQLPEVAAGEHARPRRRTRRRRGEAVGEQYSVLRHPIEGGCGQFRPAVRAALDRALVISDEEQDVRRRGAALSSGSAVACRRRTEHQYDQRTLQTRHHNPCLSEVTPHTHIGAQARCEHHEQETMSLLRGFLFGHGEVLRGGFLRQLNLSAVLAEQRLRRRIVAKTF